MQPKLVTGLRPMPAALAVGTLGFSSFFAMVALAPAMAAVHGGEIAAGAVTTAFMATTVIAQMSMARRLRVQTPGSLIRLSLLLLGVPTIGHLLLDAPAAALLFASLRGVGFGIITILTTALIATYASTKRRGAALGLFGLMTSLAGVAFPPLSMLLLEESGHWIAVVLATVLPLAGLALLGTIDRASPLPLRTGGGDLLGIRAACATRSILLPLVIFLPAAVAYGGLYSFLPLSSSAASAMLLAVGVGLASGRYAGGWLSDRMSPVRLVGPGTFAALAGLLGTALIPGGPGAPLSALLAGFGIGVTATTTLFMVMLAVGPGDGGLGSTLWNLCFDIGIGIGGIGLGVVALALGYAGAYAATAVLIAVGALVGIVGLGHARISPAHAVSSRGPTHE